MIIAGTDDAKRPGVARRVDALAGARRRCAQHALYVVDANLLHRPGPRFVDGVEQLCDALASARARRRAARSEAYNRAAARCDATHRAAVAAHDEQGIHQRRDAGRRRRRRPGRVAAARGLAQLHDAGRLRAAARASSTQLVRRSGRSSSRPSRGRRATATAPRTATTSTARSGCAKSTGASAFSCGGSTTPKSSIRPRRATTTPSPRVFFGATVTVANARRRASARSASSASTRSTPSAATSAGFRRWRARC